MKKCCAHSPSVPRRVPRILGDLPRLTQSSYREAVSQTIASRQASEGLSDQDMADLLGTSAATVGNARNRKGDLSSVSLLAVGKAFGAAELNTVLALIGAKAVPADTICCDNVAHIPVQIAEALPMLITLLGDDDCSDADVRQLDKVGIIDMLVETAALLLTRRNAVRLQDQ